MTVDFDLWTEFSKTILVIIMFIGACAGSTGGGIKVSRIMILIKSVGHQFSILVNPHQMKKIKIDSKPLKNEDVHSVTVYLACYFVIFAASVLLLTFDGKDMVTNFTSVATTINNVGPGLSLVGPTQNFAFFSSVSKLVLTADMLIGRLEVFPMLVLFSPYTWKK